MADGFDGKHLLSDLARAATPAMLALAWLLAGETGWAQPKPNIIVVMADDMGIGDTSAYLGKQLVASAPPIPLTVRTPNLERLAQMGTVFTDVHTSSTMCSTTRYALLTGRYAQRSYVKTAVMTSGWSGPIMLDPQRRTVGNMLQDSGYETWALGKWHVGLRMKGLDGNPYIGAANPSQLDFNNIMWPTPGNPNVETVVDGPLQHGYDYFLGTASNNQGYRGNLRAFIENNRVLGIPYWQATSPYADGGNGGPAVDPPDWDIARVGERLINQALDMIDSHAAGGPAPGAQPFYLQYFPLSNHSNFVPAPTINIQGQEVPIFGRSRLTNNAAGRLREDMVYETDVIVGALLDKLESTIDPQTGQPMINNTLIIFTSDNGSDRTTTSGDGGLRETKKSISEGGHRVPFIAAWPGVMPQNAVSDQVFGLHDLYATFAAITGQSLGLTEAEDSENILPAFQGASLAQFQRPSPLINHDNNYANEYPAGAVQAIRFGSMKLIVSRDLVNFPVQPAATAGQAIPLALYDLSLDLKEQNNLVNNPAYGALVQEMRRRILKDFNQGFTRSTIQPTFGPLLATDGGTDLSNALSGAIGYEVKIGSTPVVLSRLGMFDDAAGDVINQENNATNPDGDTIGIPDGLATPHWIRLWDKSTGTQLAAAQITNANSTVEGEFRYVNLPSAVLLYAEREYALTMSTAVNDGDLFHLPAPFTGVSPIPSSLVTNFAARRAAADGAYPALTPDGALAAGSATEEIHLHRLYVGPTATLDPIPSSYADFDFDGDVDGHDFLIWQRGLGTANPTRANGDADLDGVVGPLDLQLWQAAFAAHAQVAMASHGVPEPTTATAGLAALIGLVCASRRQHFLPALRARKCESV
ncbi:MAG TPA: sulfatase-like hydrolase/transferase [Lacipirellulaceae bacterium]|nr:sulfatase-like hydrolase/transferase [Lacipirellulaceae bacterium]